MIVDNVIKFGYGDISVGSFLNVLILREIEPPQKVGSVVDLNNDIIVKKIIDIPIYYTDCVELLKLIDSINNSNTKFQFKNYIFDFSLYNSASIVALSTNVKLIMDEAIRLCAC